jgi:CDP-diacylglycerol---glycerol-3-phosphate 3-phosphatidyltransferase
MANSQDRTDLYNIPNLLTYFRILCIPAVIFLLIENDNKLDIVAAAVFIVASATDFIDGWLARKLNMVSKIGILIDPLADKLLIISILIILVHQDKIAPIIPVILIWREFGILTLRSVASTQGIIISPNTLGKRKTLLQILGVSGIILGKNNDFFGIDWFILGHVLILLSVFISVISGYQYLRSYIKSVYS